MRGDGAGWVECSCGARHWGLFGAAGLLLLVPSAPEPAVLLQLRSAWSHHGGTWGLPGGALDSHEDHIAAALRETHEETGVTADDVTIHEVIHADHGPWGYATVIASTRVRLEVQLSEESTALEWVPWSQIEERQLHPSFRAALPTLGEAARRIIPW